MTDKEKAIDFLECKRAYYASLSTDPNPNVKATKVCGYTLAESANACLMGIEALKQKPKTGRWIDTDEGFSPCECSECGAVEFKKSKYCPNCGTKMEEVEEK
jgi:hypothetical protein